jgi:hypothetical protein
MTLLWFFISRELPLNAANFSQSGHTEIKTLMLVEYFFIYKILKKYSSLIFRPQTQINMVQKLKVQSWLLTDQMKTTIRWDN